MEPNPAPSHSDSARRSRLARYARAGLVPAVIALLAGCGDSEEKLARDAPPPPVSTPAAAAAPAAPPVPAWESLLAASKQAEAMGNAEQARAMLDQAVLEAERLPTVAPLHRALNDRAYFLYFKGEADALGDFERLVRARELDLASELHKLANVQSHHGRLDLADESFRRAIEIRIRQDPGDSTGALASLRRDHAALTARRDATRLQGPPAPASTPRPPADRPVMPEPDSTPASSEPAPSFEPGTPAEAAAPVEDVSGPAASAPGSTPLSESPAEAQP